MANGSVETLRGETGKWTGLTDEVLAILRCLACQNRLQQRDDGLTCLGCGKQYPVLNGVVRFVDAQNYAGSFGFQWKIHARTQLDTATSRRSERALGERTGFRPEDLAGKLVLDVGCGMGRFAEVAGWKICTWDRFQFLCEAASHWNNVCRILAHSC